MYTLFCHLNEKYFQFLENLGTTLWIIFFQNENQNSVYPICPILKSDIKLGHEVSNFRFTPCFSLYLVLLYYLPYFLSSLPCSTLFTIGQLIYPIFTLFCTICPVLNLMGKIIWKGKNNTINLPNKVLSPS